MKSDLHHSEGEQHDGAVHVHVHPVRLYLGIFFTLIALTVITVATSYIDIDGLIRPGTPAGAGGFNLALAMLIATAKATCVVTWFMHLKDDNRFNAIVFVGSVLFAGIFFAYTVNDTAYRGQTDPYNGVHVSPLTGERAPGGVDHVFPGEMPEPGIQAPPAEVEHAAEAGAPAEGGAHH